MKLSKFRILGDRLLVEVLRPASKIDVDSKLVLPDMLEEGPVVAAAVRLGDKSTVVDNLGYRQELIIHKYSGIDLEFEDAPGKKYKLLKPEEILLVMI